MSAGCSPSSSMNLASNLEHGSSKIDKAVEDRHLFVNWVE
jgi:hypothetical protein